MRSAVLVALLAAAGCTREGGPMPQPQALVEATGTLETATFALG